MTGADPSTSDVQIRDDENDDLESFFSHQLDPEALRMAVFKPRDRASFLAHWAKIRADETVVAQTIVVDGRVVGNVVSWEQSDRHLVGYWIGSRDWGRGIATKALTLFLGRATLRPLHAYVEVHNTGSIRVLENAASGGCRQDVPSPTGDEDGVEEVLLVLSQV